jgi:hypothetical protein
VSAIREERWGLGIKGGETAVEGKGGSTMGVINGQVVGSAAAAPGPQVDGAGVDPWVRVGGT